jgi:hypothetical protein
MSLASIHLFNYFFLRSLYTCCAMKKKLFVLLLSIMISLPVCAENEVGMMKHDPAEYLSNTLPVLYINTVDEAPIVSKIEYVDGYYYLDANGCGDYVSVGSADAPLPLLIKGRGNSTWNFPKKPYRLKLDAKASLLGMPKSKHWVLYAGYNEWLAGHGKTYLCFKISEKLGMPYTPRIVPCEVVLNGDYIGMYFLTEQIRVAKERVDIIEQNNLETDSTLITGGWLLEIDNYNEEAQIRFKDKGTGRTMRITYHSPEELSSEQLNYLTTLMNNVNVYVNTWNMSSREWEEYIDIDALARFYTLLEVIDDQEGFSGSCWFSKDRGEDTKLVWGPYWDTGSALGNRNQRINDLDFFYNDQDSSKRNRWIRNIVKFPRFQIAYRKWWEKYRDEVFPTMQAEVDAYGQLTEQALASDYLRWQDPSSTNIAYYRMKFMSALENKRNFLSSKWDVRLEGSLWSTYYSDTDLALPQGVMAYAVDRVDNGKMHAIEIGYVPSGQGVLLYSEINPDSISWAPYTGDKQEVFSLLAGSSESQLIDDGYILHNDVFVLVPGETKVPAHHCYIPFSSGPNSPTLINVSVNDFIAGDVNGDGLVTSTDVTVLYNYFLNNDSTNLVNPDANNDGVITSSDVTRIYSIILGN